MELTLLLAPDEAAKLQRLPVVKTARTGRARGTGVRIVWHDSHDRALASHGLALAEERGTWRLERHRPINTEPWPPATDHRLIEEVNEPRALSPVLPEATTPVAAFEGKRSVFPLTIDDEPISMTLLDGNLRAVAAERPATRLIIGGSCAIVRTLVVSLAETLSIGVPEQSLATEALQLADGIKPRPRRSGAPALPPEGMTVPAAFNHIMGHLSDVILNLAPLAADTASGPENVHHMRVAVRRARSALSLFPPAPDGPSRAPVADGLKRLGQMLGTARDWDVFMTETVPPVEAALPEQHGLRPLLRSAGRRRNAARAALAAYLTGPEFRLLSLELACLSAAEPPSSDVAPPLIDFAAGVLQTRWKKLSHAGKALDDHDDPGLHGVRLKAKRLRYAAEFFAPLFPEKPAVRFIRRLAALQERLGLFNDTTVAEALLRDLSGNPGYAAGLVLGFTSARRARARPKIADAWARFRRGDPFWE
jgi:CHAD domain-containing protein